MDNAPYGRPLGTAMCSLTAASLNHLAIGPSMQWKVIVLLAFAALTSGCAASVSRIGYDVPRAMPVASVSEQSVLETESPGAPHSVLITTDVAAIQDSSAVLLGQIRYRDSGFSTKCDEASALRLFQADAVALDANVVLITKESLPDFWSSCYRAEAGLYRVPDPVSLAQVRDQRTPDCLRVNRGARSADQLWSIIGYSAGIVVGTVLGNALFGGGD